jgi:hypothetical protein
MASVTIPKAIVLAMKTILGLTAVSIALLIKTVLRTEFVKLMDLALAMVNTMAKVRNYK